MRFRQWLHSLLIALGLLAMNVYAQDSVSTSSGQGGFTGQAHFSAPPPAGKPVTGAPYSAEETSERVQTLADGTHITEHMVITKIYRDSSGRTRIEHPMVHAYAARRANTDNVPVFVEITDPVAQVRYTLDLINKVAHKQSMGLAARDVAQRRTPPPAAKAVSREPPGDRPETSVEKLDSQIIEGVEAQGTRRTTVWPTGSKGNDRPFSVVDEDWWSPELKVGMLSIQNDPRSGQFTRKLTNVNRSEPDPSLFQPPADYQVVEEKGDFTIKWGSQNQ